MGRQRYGMVLTLVAGALALAVSAHGQGITDMKKGEGVGSSVQGSAGPSGTQNAAGDLERCDKPMGAVAVVEPQDYVGRALAKYQLGSPVGLIRLMIQQSNCFLVVERGMGMRSQRYAMIVDNGVIKDLFVEKPGAFEVSSAENVLKHL